MNRKDLKIKCIETRAQIYAVLESHGIETPGFVIQSFIQILQSQLRRKKVKKIDWKKAVIDFKKSFERRVKVLMKDIIKNQKMFSTQNILIPRKRRSHGH